MSPQEIQKITQDIKALSGDIKALRNEMRSSFTRLHSSLSSRIEEDHAEILRKLNELLRRV